MTTSAIELLIPTATAVTIAQDTLIVELSDGRRISVPLTWYPRLLHANEAERSNVRLIGSGSGLHWPEVEEDISVESIVRGRRSMERAASLERWLLDRKA